MPRPRSLWCKDFATVPAPARRVARYALQLIQGPAGGQSCLHDRGFLGALWSVTRPVFDPEAVAAFLAAGAGADQFDWSEDGDDLDVAPEADAVLRVRLRHIYATTTRTVLRRLAVVDGSAPVSPTLTLLGRALGLDPTELRVLDYLDQYDASEPLRVLLRQGGRDSGWANPGRLAAALGLTETALRSALGKSAPLRSLGLVECNSGPGDLEDYLSPSELLREVLAAAPSDADALLATLIEPAPAATWTLADFPHLSTQAEHLREAPGQAAASGAVGVNALFYGPPGTGKTRAGAGPGCRLRAQVLPGPQRRR